MSDICNSIEVYNAIRNRNILVVFDDKIADMNSNKKFLSVSEPFTRGRKLNISLVFISQPNFQVSKEVRLNTLHCFILKIANR